MLPAEDSFGAESCALLLLLGAGSAPNNVAWYFAWCNLAMADHGGETTVIDEDLIRIACEEERAHAKKPQAAGDAEVVPTPLTLPEIMRDVTTLRLSFKNINKIDNLAGFSQLTKLCLDNNAIDQIEGIDQLEASVSQLIEYVLTVVSITETRGPTSIDG